MLNFYDRLTYLFDPLHNYWESAANQKRIGSLLVVIFITSLLTIEVNRIGLIPSFLADLIPINPFYAVHLAFSCVLIVEVISLIFILPCSFSKSVGKQFEILILILLRNSFKELINFTGTIALHDNINIIFNIASDAFGALIVFTLLGVYYHIQNKRKKNTHKFIYQFVAAKKGVALIMFVLFIIMGLINIINKVTGHTGTEFFASFYTMLIFSDILLVLISQRHLPAFYAVFRNSGFAVCTLLIRMALAAPPYFNAGLGIAAALFAIGLTLACEKFYPFK